MRLYVDRFTDRGRTQLALLIADVVAIATAVTFASGVCSRADRWLEAVCVAVWAAVPRLLAPYLRWLRYPRPFGETLAYALGLVLLAALLFMGGVDLLWGSLPREARPPIHSVGLIFMLWTSSFLLFHPLWYRVHDVALAGTVLMGLVEREPYPLVAVLLFVGSLAVSSAVRNLLHNVYLEVRKPLINLQNARAAAAMATVSCGVAFVALFYFFSYWVPYESPPVERPGAGEWARSDRSSDSGLDAAETEISRESDSGPGGRAERGTGGSRPGRFTSPPIQVGYTEEVRLSNSNELSGGGDDTVAVRIRVPKIADRARWGIDARTLFRVSAAAVPNDSGDSWKPAVRPETFEWREGTVLRGEVYGASDLLTAEIEVLVPSISTLVTPYRTSHFGAAFESRLYRRTSVGDVVLTPAPAPGVRYLVHFRPLSFDGPGLAQRVRLATGRHRDPETLRLPDRPGFDVRALASVIFRGEVTIGGKIRALRRYFRENGFEYALTTEWRAEENRLAAFLVRERNGDCNYFSVAATVLLRAGGVSTRLAAGFTGAELEVETGDYLLRQRTAHAWTEYFVPSLGWLPIDPTTWVSSREGGGGEGPTPPSAVAIDDPSSTNPPAEPQGPRPDGSRDEADARLAAAGAVGASGSSLDSSARDGSRTTDFVADGSAPEALQPRTKSESSAVGSIEAPGGDESLDGVSVADRAEMPNPMRSALTRLALLIFAGVLAGLTVRRLLDPKAKDEESDVSPERATVSDPLSGVPLEPPNYEPQNDDEWVVFHYQKLQYELSRTRRSRHPHETPTQHARRFRGESEELDAAFASLNARLYSLLYASRSMTSEDVTTVEESCRLIRKTLG